jgi:hypothetical protein
MFSKVQNSRPTLKLPRRPRQMVLGQPTHYGPLVSVQMAQEVRHAQMELIAVMIPRPQRLCLGKPVPKPRQPHPPLGCLGPKPHEDPDVERAKPGYGQPVWRGGFPELQASGLLRQVEGALL